MDTIMQNPAQCAIPADGIEATVTAIVDAEPATAPKRPFWQTEPCPTWCTEVHTDRELDRTHAATPAAPMDLTLYEAQPVDEHVVQPAKMDASIWQHYRAAEPTITLTVPTHDRARTHQVTGDLDVEMTRAEATALRDRLTLILTQLDGARRDPRLPSCPAWCVSHEPEAGLHYGAPETVSYLDQLWSGGVPETVEVQVYVEDESEAVTIGGNLISMDPAGALRMAQALIEAAAKVREQ